MGSFLEEIIKGGLGNVLGGSSNNNSGGGMEDILKDITGRGNATTVNKKSSGDIDMSDIAKSIRKNAGASGSAPQRTPQEVSVNDIETETNSNRRGLNDIVKEMRRKMGMEVEEEEPVTKTTRKTSRKAQQEEEMQQQQQGGINIGGLGGLGAILAILLGQGINLGNLGDIAKSIIKTIGVAGGAVRKK